MEIGSIFLEKYRILRKIGKGGMGNVYLAEDLNDYKQYAIKEQEVSDKRLDLILSEINIQRKLEHPALPKIHFVHETASSIYIIMEYIEGRTIEAMLEETGFFPQERVVKWALQLCDILGYLHGLEHPVVYRDLKPSNIMIDENDRLHLIDFGIALEYRKQKKGAGKTLTLTRGYAAPEQYESRYYSDIRTDIYSLGVTLHYLLTGKNPLKPPYHFVKARKLNKNISYGMEAIVKKCLQPNPDQRYDTAQILRRELMDLEILDKKLAQKRKVKAIVFVAGLLATSIILALLYRIVGEKRSTQISKYYEQIQSIEELLEKDNMK